MTDEQVLARGAAGGLLEAPAGQPQRHAIFSPLHVNREARAVWLPRFFQPPREQISELNIHFDTPFINYDTDFFTIFDGWPLDGLENGIATSSSVVDGFMQDKIVRRDELLNSGYMYSLANTIEGTIKAEKSALQRASSTWQMIPRKMGWPFPEPNLRNDTKKQMSRPCARLGGRSTRGPASQP